MMKTYQVLIAIILLFFVAGVMLTPTPIQAGPDPCNHGCPAVVCGEPCYPPPATVPPIKLYRCYTWGPNMECMGPTTCGCVFIGCTMSLEQCGFEG
jgi:hypothetical protein